jgi:hypothetical protein
LVFLFGFWKILIFNSGGFRMLIYVIIAIGSLWGIITLVALREEEKEIKELIDSARKANQERRELK